MKVRYDKEQYWFRRMNSIADWNEFQNMNFKHEPEISVIETVYEKQVCPADPGPVFDAIKNGEFADIIMEIRQTPDPSQRRELKKQLPCILFGGTFATGRKELTEASNLICLDFDHVENLEKKRMRLQFSRFIYGMFLSPSGDGLKVIVRTDVEDSESYKKTAALLIKEFASSGLNADSSKQNINDPCYFSYDPDAFYNPEASIWRHITYEDYIDVSNTIESISKQVENVIVQIEEKQYDITKSYDAWLNVCFALTNQFEEEGRDYFHRVSKFYPKYDESECNKQFDYCLKSKGEGITIKTFFKIAKENGFNIQYIPAHPVIKPDPFDQEYYTGEDLLLRSIEKLPTLIDPIFPKSGLVALGGSSDVGKSTFLRHLAINICTGSDNFLNFPILARHNRVIYVSTEDDDSAIGYLLDVQNKQLGKTSSSYKNLIFLFDTTNILERLEKMLKASPADLVIVDTISDLFTGDMNQANKIRSYLQNYSILAKKYQCLVLVLHHTGKRTEDLPPSKNNLLGSQGFEAKMRLVLELRTDRDDQDLRHLCIVKANYLSKEYKEASYVLKFDSNMLFENTGQRVLFDDLTGSKKDKEAYKQEWIAIARPLVEEGKTYLEVSEILKTQAFNVSKSTIQREIPKN